MPAFDFQHLELYMFCFLPTKNQRHRVKGILARLSSSCTDNRYSCKVILPFSSIKLSLTSLSRKCVWVKIWVTNEEHWRSTLAAKVSQSTGNTREETAALPAHWHPDCIPLPTDPMITCMTFNTIWGVKEFNQLSALKREGWWFSCH